MNEDAQEALKYLLGKVIPCKPEIVLMVLDIQAAQEAIFDLGEGEHDPYDEYDPEGQNSDWEPEFWYFYPVNNDRIKTFQSMGAWYWCGNQHCLLL